MQDSFTGNPDQLTVVKPRRIGTALLAVASILILLGILNAFRTGDIGWQYVSANLFSAPVMRGVVGTIVMTFCAMALGIVLGVAAAMMRMSENKVLQSISIGYVWLFRGTPTLLQLLLWFNLALIFPRI